MAKDIRDEEDGTFSAKGFKIRYWILWQRVGSIDLEDKGKWWNNPIIEQNSNKKWCILKNKEAIKVK